MNINYYEDAYLKECTTKVIKSFETEKGFGLKLEDNIFYAKGGGQKADRGTIAFDDETANVLTCIKDEDGTPLLLVDKFIEEGKEVKCILDFDFRYTQMRLHTALHLLHCYMEDYYKKALEYPLSSNIEADFAYNKYPEGLVNDEVIEHVNMMFKKTIEEDHKVSTYPDENNPLYRYWTCMDYVIPCGGIHVSSLKELGVINVSYHTKKGVTTVKLTLG